MNCGKRINSTGGGSAAEYSLYKLVMSAGFKALRDNIEDKAWLARGCAAEPLRPIMMAVTLWPLRSGGEESFLQEFPITF